MTTTASAGAVATMAAALRQAAKERGYAPTDMLLAMMIGQMLGAEGAMPGLVGTTLSGTNNIGAANVPGGKAGAAFAVSKKAIKGWGAYAHRDGDPNKGAFIAWFWMAPSALEAARYWLAQWWGDALLKKEPTTAREYARILYAGGYFGGKNKGDTRKDPDSAAGRLNVADYAHAITLGMPALGELHGPPGDPAAVTVDPKVFPSLEKRGVTEALYDQAVNGGLGSAWRYLLPKSWSEMKASGGVVWFGPAVGSIGAMFADVGIVAAGATAGALLSYLWEMWRSWTGRKG